jgi:phosphoserine phosphatase RsbU/P
MSIQDTFPSANMAVRHQTNSLEPCTILLVDDEPITRMVAKRRLTQLGHRVLEAENGRTAWEIINENRVDLILSDWMMPGLDGIGLCEMVKRDALWRNIHFILMTACDQPDQIAEGLSRGADDYLPKTATDQEIIARINAGLRTRRLFLDLERTNRLLSAKQAELELELQSGADYVRSLLPAVGEVVPGVTLDWRFLPSLKLGGDLFQVNKWGSDFVGIMMLDMSGHGIGAAMRAVGLSEVFRDARIRIPFRSLDPGHILSKLNREYPLTDQGEYFTIWLGTYQWSTQTLRYATAGHPGGILLRQNESGHVLGGKTWPIGFCPNETCSSYEVRIQEGDRLYVFSDGIFEVMNREEEIWGSERLRLALEGIREVTIGESLEKVIQKSREWQGKDIFSDDVAVLSLEFKMGPSEARGNSTQD